MNYLLVMPKDLSTGASTTSKMFPLGIAYVSASLKQGGYSVYTANIDFPERDTYSVLQEMLTKHQIDVLCTGGLSLDCHKIKELLDIAQEIKPEIITVVGGGIISSDPETAMRVLDPDVGVIGEGEITMCELAHALNNDNSIKDVPGLIYWDKERTLITTSRRKEIKDLDSIPFPDLDSFNYGEWVNSFGGSGMILSDRSCPMRCTFCFHLAGEKYRQRSIDNIFAEIDYQYKKYGLNHLVLNSELISTNKQRVEEFCERIKKYNITWSGCLRVTCVDAELMHKMKDSGCYEICFGLESADNSVLKSMRKNITVEQIANALDLAYEVGIHTDACNFIFGDINETTETVKNTLDFWWRYNYKTHINLNRIQTFPGTYLYEYACKNGIITDKEKFLKDGCPVVNVSRLNETEFHELTSLITELRLHTHVPAKTVHIEDISENGCCRLDFSCRRCDSKNFTQSLFWHTETCKCTHCGAKNEVDTIRGAFWDQEVFFSNLPTNSSIGLWGAGGIYYKLIHNLNELKSDRFILIDANTEWKGLSICNKIINSPQTLDNDNMQTVIITALSRKDEIYANIRSNYPSVKQILIPAFDITPKGIVPVLRTI